MFKKLNLRVLTNAVVVYMLIAFTWWTVLLYIKNRDAFLAKAELMGMGMAAQGVIQTHEDLVAQPAYRELRSKYQHQEWMIYGEAAVFVVSLVFGIYMINRGHKIQVNSEQQTRNFLLSITHELKSPLASMRLALETIEKRDLPRDTNIKLAKNAIKESDRLTSLVNDLLLAAKVEGVYSPLFEEIDIQYIMSDEVANYRQKYPEANIEFIRPDEPLYINADLMGITSVIDNLIENALKYSFEKQEIHVMLAEKDNKIFISIADSGIGISDLDKKKIFDKFYRVGNEDTRRTKGTGLGLYIVSEIVKLHKGKITVSDNSPSGTVFKIVLPK
jgi:signal transduction histidine kinase